MLQAASRIARRPAPLPRLLVELRPGPAATARRARVGCSGRRCCGGGSCACPRRDGGVLAYALARRDGARQPLALGAWLACAALAQLALPGRIPSPNPTVARARARRGPAGRRARPVARRRAGRGWRWCSGSTWGWAPRWPARCSPRAGARSACGRGSPRSARRGAAPAGPLRRARRPRALLGPDARFRARRSGAPAAAAARRSRRLGDMLSCSYVRCGGCAVAGAALERRRRSRRSPSRRWRASACSTCSRAPTTSTWSRWPPAAGAACERRGRTRRAGGRVLPAALAAGARG